LLDNLEEAEETLRSIARKNSKYLFLNVNTDVILSHWRSRESTIKETTKEEIV
jgi:hypothetical protein